MAKKPQWIVGLALGDRQFTLAVGQILDHGRLLVKALESIPAQGVERGVLSDAVECSDAIARLVQQAEKTLSTRISKITVAVHGGGLRGGNANASIPIPDPGVGISKKDVERAVSACKTLSLDYDRQLIHTFERGFSVDGQAGIKDPVGLSGKKLGVDLHLMTAQNLLIQNLLKVINRAGVEVENLVLPGLAAAEAVLSDLDRDLGVTLVYIGESQTEILLFTDGAVRETFLVPWGTDHLAESFSRTLKLPKANAEQILEQVKGIEQKPEWAAVPFRFQTGSLVRTIPQEQVAGILTTKSAEFLDKVKHRLEDSTYFRESASGIVMIGELAQLEGFLEASEGALHIPVRLGTIREIEMDSNLELSAAYTVPIGLLRYSAKKHALAAKTAAGPLWRRCLDKAHQIFDEYF